MTALDAIQGLFPLVLGLHTWDELRQPHAFVRSTPLRRWAAVADVPALACAAVLLVLAATAASVAAYTDAVAWARVIIEAAVFALLVNALGHVAGSMLRRERVPGTGSAVVLVLPYAFIAIAVMRAQWHQSPTVLLGYAALGAVGMPLAALAFLLTGHLAAQLWRTRSGDSSRSGNDAPC